MDGRSVKYLFTYKNGKKALGLSSMNRGYAMKVGDTTVYPLLVSTTAQNASCVRFKSNGVIKSFAYAPTLIIPGVLCSKMGSSYVDAVGIDYSNKAKFYSQCYYDFKYGDYVAYSSYGDNLGNPYQFIAISLDGINWTERSIYEYGTDNAAAKGVASTDNGVVIFSCNYATQYGPLNVNADIYYKNANGIQKEHLLTFVLESGQGPSNIQDLKCRVTTNGDNIAIVSFTYFLYYDYKIKIFSVNLKTNTKTDIGTWNNESLTGIPCYNKILKKFFYKITQQVYESSDGVNFSPTAAAYNQSYGNLNGFEVFSGGLSSDGINITIASAYIPNAFDPIEKKYLHVETSYRGTGQGSDVIYYADIYESSNLSSWTKILTKELNTPLAPRSLSFVSCDGFANVKGF